MLVALLSEHMKADSWMPVALFSNSMAVRCQWHYSQDVSDCSCDASGISLRSECGEMPVARLPVCLRSGAIGTTFSTYFQDERAHDARTGAHDAAQPVTSGDWMPMAPLSCPIAVKMPVALPQSIPA